MEIAHFAAILDSGKTLPSVHEPKAVHGFADTLHAAKAPPGPEPPPNKVAPKGEKEQQTVEPNAQSKKPDLSSSHKETGRSEDRKIGGSENRRIGESEDPKIGRSEDLKIGGLEGLGIDGLLVQLQLPGFA